MTAILRCADNPDMSSPRASRHDQSHSTAAMVVAGELSRRNGRQGRRGRRLSARPRRQAVSATGHKGVAILVIDGKSDAHPAWNRLDDQTPVRKAPLRTCRLSQGRRADYAEPKEDGAGPVQLGRAITAPAEKRPGMAVCGQGTRSAPPCLDLCAALSLGSSLERIRSGCGRFRGTWPAPRRGGGGARDVDCRRRRSGSHRGHR